MNTQVAKKLKKYMLYICVLFFLVLGGHLAFTYLYDGAESEAIEGGTVSEAIIGSFPHFNPLIPSSDHNEYINALLYRSMLQYSTTTGGFESDLVSCNLDDLLYIECVLEPNIMWSDGSNIDAQDIATTLGIIKETRVNPILASLLDDTTIETSSDSISFTRQAKDINFLKIFFQPIIPKSVTEQLNSENVDGEFSEINGLYSGRFRLINISQDETVGITKLTLGKNENFHNNDLLISFLILNLFRDESHFLKNKNSFNIFNDKDAIIGSSIPRLESYEYTLAQFAGIFFNTESIKKDFREFLQSSIDRDEVIQSIGENKVSPAFNPFLSETDIESSSNFDISEYLASIGYYSKKDLIKSALDSQTQNISEPTISNEAVVSEIIPSKTQEELQYITSPTTQKYNFVSEDNILIRGEVDPGVEAVYINEYKLSGFSSGDDEFFYRLLEGYDSIQLGENSYSVYFEIGKDKKLIEEFVYIYNTDEGELEKIRSEYFDQKVEPAPSSGSGEIIQQDKPEIKLETNVEVLEALEEGYYYNNKGERYSLTIVYTKEDADISVSIQNIIQQLSEIGIFVEDVGLSLGDITTGLRNESLQYDMMLLGINLGFLGSDIFPYFHSGQVQNGYNISNFKKLSLDILLEELKSNNLSNEKKKQLEEKMLEILKEESVVKVLYTPKIQLLVDQNIKNFEFPSTLPDSKYRYVPLIDSYLSEKKIISSGEKSFYGFIKFLFSKI